MHSIFAYSSGHGSDNPWVLVIVLVTVPAILIFGYFQKKKGERNLSALAERLGFATTPDLNIPAIHHPGDGLQLNWNLTPVANLTQTGIVGDKRGKNVHISSFTVGAGKSQQSWVEVAVCTKAVGFEFLLKPENLGSKLLELLGQHELKIGDDEFDRRWRITTNLPGFLMALLLPELRAKMDDLTKNANGVFVLDSNWVRYQIQGSFANDSCVALLESMVDLMCDLADAIDVTSGKFSAPPPPPSPNLAYDDDKKDDDWGEAAPEYDRSP